MDSYDKRLVDANKVKEFKEELAKIEKAKKVERILVRIDTAIRNKQEHILLLGKYDMFRKNSEISEEIEILKKFGYYVTPVEYHGYVQEKYIEELLKISYPHVLDHFIRNPNAFELVKICWDDPKKLKPSH